MKFCENCGKPVNENSQFCENCGAKIKKSVITEQPQKNNNSKSSKNRRNIIFAVIGVLVLIFVVSSLFSSFNSEGKIKKDEYLKIYDEAVKKTETANFIQAKVELEKLQDTKSYDGIDIKKDIDMTVQLFGIRNFVSSKDLTEENIINAFKTASSEVKESLIDVIENRGFSFPDLANIQQGEIAKVFGVGGGNSDTTWEFFEVL